MLEVRVDGLVLEKVDGVTMRDAVATAKSITVSDAAEELARLHERLHAITTADGRVLVHGDLHWKNVIEAAAGPVVIDWANAGSGDPALDTALTWIILATSSGRLGRALANRFAHIVDVQTGKNAAAKRRLTDANLTLAERQAVTKLLH